jgi:glycosyltransferase involved in cell wall biosynthesis
MVCRITSPMPSSFFSIIVPTYNRSAFLPRAIQSVLDQTFYDFELIVVDDGSTDNTADVVSRFTDPRIKYYKKENEERSIARNFGIDQSLGRYINFLDVDDYFYPHHLMTAYHYLQSANEPEVFHLGYELKNNNSVIHKYDRFAETFNYNLPLSNELSCNAIFIRSDVAAEFSFIPDERAVVSEDWYVWLRLGARFKFHYANEITSVVCDHQDRSLYNRDPFKFEKSINLIIMYLDKDPEVARFYGSNYSYFKSENLSMVALCYSESYKQKRKALKYLIKATRVFPRLVLRRRFWAILRNIFLSRK